MKTRHFIFISATLAFFSSAAFAAPKQFTVALDGTGDFKTVQAAIDAAPTDGAIIELKPGTYDERVVIDKTKPHITLRGIDADAKNTVLTHAWFANFTPPAATQPVGTSGSASTTIDADDFSAERITFANTAGEVGQAVALKITGDRARFDHCRFLGWQDTLCADDGRQYYRKCYLEGRVDFLFGGATAVFDRCEIKSKNGGYVTAARTLPERPFGYVFLDCKLTSNDHVPTFLGRPWQWDRGRHASVAFIRCAMGDHIRPEGWNQWDRPNNPNTDPASNTRYAEFSSTDLAGKPLDTSKRVEWSKQLSEDDAKKLTVENILGGDDRWNPTKE
jgi:pectinesterase